MYVCTFAIIKTKKKKNKNKIERHKIYKIYTFFSSRACQVSKCAWVAKKRDLGGGIEAMALERTLNNTASGMGNGDGGPKSPSGWLAE